MPALYTLWNTRLEKRWTVGSDDFVLPTIVAVSVLLVGFILVVGVLVYLYVAPVGCNDLTLEAPPWLYGTLFATLLLEFAVLMNDAVIMSISCRGRIDHSREPGPDETTYMFDMAELSIKKRRWLDPDSTSPRRSIKWCLYFRVFLFLLEIVLSGFYGYAVWSPQITDQILQCDRFTGPVYFARGVAITWWIVIIISSILWSVFLDPIGICSPRILEELNNFSDEEEDKEADSSEHTVLKFRAHIGWKRIKRRLMSLFCCCLGVVRHRERGVALEDAARVMQSIFNDVDLVGSDLVAGLILLNRDQRRKIRNNECLVSDYKKLTFEMMANKYGEQMISRDYGDKGKHLCQVSKPSFEDNLKEYILLDDLVHFCHYALGVYGWPLYVYDNLNCGSGCCGLNACCRLTAKTCCYCNRLSERKANGDIMDDNLCFCGLASVQLMSPDHSLREEDIKHINFENECFKCPYLLCVDHAMKAVVVCVRGTLSFKDVLTDITVSVTELTKDEVGDKFNVKAAYVHTGMYNTAVYIRGQLLKPDKPILTKTLNEYERDHYRLVIVGHSLGAGVASILAVLLKDYFPDLVCYAYSPPGCVFSFPLVQYSKEFITSVVIGNDMVPRLSIRTLHYMKRQIETLLKNCKKPKHQVLFQPRYCDRICHMCTSVVEDPSVSMEDVKHKLFKESYSTEVTPPRPALPPKPILTTNRADSILSWACCGSRGLKKQKKPAVKKATRQHKPSFAPGSILHLNVKQKQKASCLGPCTHLQVTPEWMESEDLGVIIADRGMIEDHMPTRVLEVLRTYHKQVSVNFTKQRVQAEREEIRLENIRNLIDKRSYFDLLIRGAFKSDKLNWSPGEDEPDGRLVADGREEESSLGSRARHAAHESSAVGNNAEENSTYVQMENGVIASDDKVEDPVEEGELNEERVYALEGYYDPYWIETTL